MPITAPAPALSRQRPPGPRGTPGWLAAAGLVLLTAACGGSPGAVSSPPANTTSGSTTSGNTASAFTTRLAFARCVRAHGVPSYPDPDSNGLEPPGTKQLFISNSRFQTAVSSCRHLLPNGGHPAQAPQANAMTEAGALRLAGCVRAHGYPAFPDPIIDSAGQPVFNVQAAGLPAHSPQLLATLRRCLSRLHLTGLPENSS